MKDLTQIPFSVENLYMLENPTPCYGLEEWYTPEQLAEFKREHDEAQSKVLFKGIRISWDSCDCGDGYGCSHGSWPFEIRVADNGKHDIAFEDDGISFSKDKRCISWHDLKGMTMADFVRSCEYVGIKLEPAIGIERPVGAGTATSESPAIAQNLQL